MAAAAKLQFDSVMDQAFSLHSCAKTHLTQKIDSSLLEHSCTHAFLYVLAAPVFDDDALDTLQTQKFGEEKTRRTRAYDADLRAYVLGHSVFILITRLSSGPKVNRAVVHGHRNTQKVPMCTLQGLKKRFSNGPMFPRIRTDLADGNSVSERPKSDTFTLVAS